MLNGSLARSSDLISLPSAAGDADEAAAAGSLPDPLPPFSSHLFPSLRGGQQSRNGGARRETSERDMGKFLLSF